MGGGKYGGGEWIKRVKGVVRIDKSPHQAIFSNVKFLGPIYRI